MSVMMLNNEIYENCHRTISSDGYLVNGSKWALYGFLDWCYYDQNEFTKLQGFFKSLIVLNAKSWNARYNENEPISNNLDFTRGKTLNPYQLLKSLECIAYQIEGDELTDSNTFGYLERMISELTGRILGNIPEYENAKWGDIE